MKIQSLQNLMKTVKLKIAKLSPLVLSLGAVLLLGGGAAIATIGIGGGMFGGGVNLQDGLIGHWKLDGNTNDATIYNNHGTVNGDGGGAVLGEAGKFTSPEDAGWKTVEFANSYTTPVVVGTNNTHNGEAALVFESRNVTNNSAEMRLCESEGSTTGCDTHTSETVGYMVIDAAETDSVAGIEAGTFDIDSGLDTKTTTVSFGETFGTTPQVMTAVNTVNGTAPVEGQARSVTTTDFVGAICQQDALDSCNDSHVTETVGWVAIEPGNEPFNEQVEANSTGNAVSNSAWTSQTFASAFSDTPVIVVETQTNDGGQDALVDEARNITTTGAEVRYCEMQSGDTCDGHTTEDVGWLAVERGVLTTGNMPAHPNLDRKYAKNGAYEFDGVDDYINSSYQSEATRTGTYSVSMWFKSTGTTEQSLWQNSGSCSDRNGIQTNGTDWASFGYYNGSSYTRASGPINSGQWNHVVGVNNGGTLTIYVNGTEYSGTNGGYIHCSNNYMYTGRTSNSSAPRFFEGRIDDVRLYERTLSSEEVSALHDSYDSSGVQVATTQKNLVSHWKMDGNGSDATPHSNHGTVNGATATTDRHGQSSSAYNFDGTDDYIELPFSSALGIDRVSTCLWAYANGSQSNEYLFDGQDHRWLIKENDNSETLRGTVQTSNGTFSVDTTNVIPNQQWAFVCLTYDGNQLTLYLHDSNGLIEKRENTNASGNVISNTGNGRIGDYTGGGYEFAGKIDDVRIYGRAISESEISDLHDSYNPTVQISDLSKKLKGHWTLNGDAKDKTPYSNHGALEGGPTLTTDRHGRTDSAYEFDGADDQINLGQDDVLQPDDVTVTLWFKADNTTDGTFIFSQYLSWMLQYRGGNLRWRNWYDDNGTRTEASNHDSYSLSSGSWYFTALSISGNGDSNQWVIGPGINNNSTRNFPGSIWYDSVNSVMLSRSGWWSSGSTRFDGKVDDVRIYSRTLNNTEVQTLYETYR